eukprot:g10528.t1
MKAVYSTARDDARFPSLYNAARMSHIQDVEGAFGQWRYLGRIFSRWVREEILQGLVPFLWKIAKRFFVETVPKEMASRNLLGVVVGERTTSADVAARKGLLPSSTEGEDEPAGDAEASRSGPTPGVAADEETATPSSAARPFLLAPLRVLLLVCAAAMLHGKRVMAVPCLGYLRVALELLYRDLVHRPFLKPVYELYFFHCVVKDETWWRRIVLEHRVNDKRRYPRNFQVKYEWFIDEYAALKLGLRRRWQWLFRNAWRGAQCFGVLLALRLWLLATSDCDVCAWNKYVRPSEWLAEVGLPFGGMLASGRSASNEAPAASGNGNAHSRSDEHGDKDSREGSVYFFPRPLLQMLFFYMVAPLLRCFFVVPAQGLLRCCCFLYLPVLRVWENVWLAAFFDPTCFLCVTVPLLIAVRLLFDFSKHTGLRNAPAQVEY